MGFFSKPKHRNTPPTVKNPICPKCGREMEKVKRGSFTFNACKSCGKSTLYEDYVDEVENDQHNCY
jgi:ribosomal protein L37AE/L43A